MFKIMKPSDPIEAGILKALFYGQPGIGKTSFAFTAPRALLLDTEGGVRRVSPERRGDYVAVNSWEDIQDLFNHDLSKYDSIVVDTVSSAMTLLIRYLIESDYRYARKGGELSLQGYGALKAQFVQFVNQVSTMGKHLILIAHDMEKKDGDDTILRPDIVGGTFGEIMKHVDIVAYMESKNNKRVISFNATDRHYGKNTCELPEFMDVDTVSVEAIIESYHNMLGRQNEINDQYHELLATIDGLCDIVKDSKTASTVSEELKELSSLWDSKYYARQKFREAIAACGVTYDKDKGELVELSADNSAEASINEQREPQTTGEVLAPAKSKKSLKKQTKAVSNEQAQLDI